LAAEKLLVVASRLSAEAAGLLASAGLSAPGVWPPCAGEGDRAGEGTWRADDRTERDGDAERDHAEGRGESDLERPCRGESRMIRGLGGRIHLGSGASFIILCSNTRSTM
jgi:hypothetical protein